jgi:hypothetical protein
MVHVQILDLIEKLGAPRDESLRLRVFGEVEQWCGADLAWFHCKGPRCRKKYV